MTQFSSASGATLDRRDFTTTTLLALLAGVTVTIVGCDDDDSPTSPTSPSPSSGDRTGSVSANHGHRAIITGAQLGAGNAVTLNIRGDADHPHTVEITMGEVAQIASGQRVSKVSSTDQAHNHTVVFN